MEYQNDNTSYIWPQGCTRTYRIYPHKSDFKKPGMQKNYKLVPGLLIQI